MKKKIVLLLVLFTFIFCQNDHETICSKRRDWICCQQGFKCCYTNIECAFNTNNKNYYLTCGGKGYGCYKETPSNQVCEDGLTRMYQVFAGSWKDVCGLKINV